MEANELARLAQSQSQNPFVKQRQRSEPRLCLAEHSRLWNGRQTKIIVQRSLHIEPNIDVSKFILGFKNNGLNKHLLLTM